MLSGAGLPALQPPAPHRARPVRSAPGRRAVRDTGPPGTDSGGPVCHPRIGPWTRPCGPGRQPVATGVLITTVVGLRGVWRPPYYQSTCTTSGRGVEARLREGWVGGGVEGMSRL